MTPLPPVQDKLHRDCPRSGRGRLTVGRLSAVNTLDSRRDREESWWCTIYPVSSHETASAVHARDGMRSVRPFFFLLPFTVAIAFIYNRAESQVVDPGASSPRVELVPAPPIKLPGDVDSNSPAVWQLVAGRWFLHVMTSVAGAPSYAWGSSLTTLSPARSVAIVPWPGEGVWMEAVVADVDGTWYGYYHNERLAQQCGQTDKVIPRIGAARSDDRGANWVDLGIILEAPPGAYDCQTSNRYFVGGIGDLSVMPDPEWRDLYIFYSQYVRQSRGQGVTVARMAWADRDRPVGKATVWRGRMWTPARRRLPADGNEDAEPTWTYPFATPILPAAESWHDGDDQVDAFWGPSVHWNTHLKLYVMLLNHARDAEFGQEGIYVSFAPKLDAPGLWSTPVKILDGGSWYPQVIGVEPAVGTDKV